MIDIHQFSHASRTNVKAKKLTNHDFVALLLAINGPMKFEDIKSMIRAWRGRALACTYLFNTCHSGGYGFVGKDAFSKGNWINRTSYGSCYTSFKNEKESPRDTFRRTYWYRSSRGVYAITLEGIARMAVIMEQVYS